MLAQRLASFTMKGLPQAVLAAVGFTVLAFVLPPFGLVSGAIVALVALRLGWTQASYTVLLSSLALGILMLVSGQAPIIGFAAGIAQWLPMALLGLLLRVEGNWTRTLQATLAVGLVIVVATQVLVPDISTLWQSLLDQYIKPLLQQQANLPLEQQQAVDQILATLAQRLTGFLVASLILSSLLSLMLARAMQASVFNPGGFGQEFRELRLGLWPTSLGLLLIAVDMVSEWSLPEELLLVLAVGFLLQGFAVVHGLVTKLNWHKGILIGIYVACVVFLTPMLTLLSGLGMADAFADFRQRIKRPGY